MLIGVIIQACSEGDESVHSEVKNGNYLIADKVQELLTRHWHVEPNYEMSERRRVKNEGSLN